MKKYFAMILAGMMAVSLAACGGSSNAPAAAPAAEPAAEAEAAEAEAPEAEAPEAEAQTDAQTDAAFTTVEPGELHMATNAAFPPYEMTSDNGGY